METIADRINQRITDLRTSQEELANTIGISQAAISKICRGETKRSRYFPEIAKALGVTEPWLMFGEGPIEKEMQSNASFSNYVLAPWGRGTPLDDDEVEIPFLNEVALSAGNGCEPQPDYNGMKLRFSKATFRRIGVDPNHAVCVAVEGESMEPVYIDGSTVAIDRNSTHIKDGNVYAIDNEGLLQIKILKRISIDTVSIESYHPEYKPIAKKLADIKVIGRVFWHSALY